jgi:hypothetical protein
MLEL